MSGLFFNGAVDRDAALDTVIADNSSQMDAPAIVQELADWIRFSPARAIETGHGLFAA